MTEIATGTIDVTWINCLMEQAEIQEYQPTSHSLVVTAQFPHAGGFVLFGANACLRSTEFSLEIGRKMAMDQIRDQLWTLEGYRHAVDAHTVVLEGCTLTAEVMLGRNGGGGYVGMAALLRDGSPIEGGQGYAVDG